MQQLFNVFLAIHIAGGFAGLAAGILATMVVKGKKTHLLTGKIFFYSMLAAGLSALVISNLPNHHNLFLFAVGGFTLYLIMSGYRIIWIKRNLHSKSRVFTHIDFGITLFGLGFGIYLLSQSVFMFLNGRTFGLVPGVFGLICILLSWRDFRIFSGKVSIKQKWITHHLSRMIGALIASYTAFLVVNVQIEMQWILWLLPGAIGGVLIRKFLVKYRPKKKVAAIA